MQHKFINAGELWRLAQLKAKAPHQEGVWVWSLTLGEQVWEGSREEWAKEPGTAKAEGVHADVVGGKVG